MKPRFYGPIVISAWNTDTYHDTLIIIYRYHPCRIESCAVAFVISR